MFTPHHHHHHKKKKIRKSNRQIRNPEQKKTVQNFKTRERIEFKIKSPPHQKKKKKNLNKKWNLKKKERDWKKKDMCRNHTNANGWTSVVLRYPSSNGSTNVKEPRSYPTISTETINHRIMCKERKGVGMILTNRWWRNRRRRRRRRRLWDSIFTTKMANVVIEPRIHVPLYHVRLLHQYGTVQQTPRNLISGPSIQYTSHCCCCCNSCCANYCRKI